MPTNLVFGSAPLTTQPINLVFGETDAPPLVDATVVLSASLPALAGAVGVALGITATLAAALPALTGSVAVAYNTDTHRPTVGRTLAEWQQAHAGEVGVQNSMQATVPQPHGEDIAWQPAMAAPAPVAAAHTQSLARWQGVLCVFEGAMRLGTQTNPASHQDGTRTVRPTRQLLHQNAVRVGTQILCSPHQDAWRDRRAARTALWQVALRNRVLGLRDTAGKARTFDFDRASSYQQAMRPPAGRYVVPAQPSGPTVYPRDGNLLFECPPLTGFPLHLVFGAQACYLPVRAHVVVPFLRTYVTINSITLRRVDGDLAIPTYAFQMSLDVDSWTWSWSASVQADALPLVQPGSNGELVEVEALVNGVPYRLYAEGIASQRQFGQARIAVKGRGKAAMLDAPYAPVLNHGNTVPRTAQQLMLDVLTVNGVGIGWSVDWSLTDWLVPGNTWATQGAYIGAVLNIAQAAGGYVQPHDTAQTLRILPRYPAAPWDWAAVTPDFELPAAVVAVEGIDWTRKADYNRVFVSGTNNGVLGQVTRAGTAGGSVAPMVTDALITHADAARQRGLAILSDTGRQARVTLTLPVLAETGLIKPGQFVRYLAGGESRLGLVRSTSLAWSRPKLRQTIAVETHIL